jgi:hypothetical protein
MVAVSSSRRSDEHLQSILYETANWTVNGAQGMVLCEVASLRLAIEKATQLAAKGREVVAFMCRRPAEIVVLSGQVRKLTNLLVESRISSSPGVADFLSKAVNGFDISLPVLMPNGANYHEVTAPNVMPGI